MTQNIVSGLIVPTVHLNGTSRGELLQQLEVAYGKVQDARDALVEAAPNGRDYYVQGPDALQRANDEHLGRVQRLNDVLSDLQTLLQAVFDQAGRS